jgi:hypothetical protein
VLSAAGFRLAQRWLNLMVPLTTDPEQAMAALSRKRRQSINRAVRDGVEVNEGGLDRLDEFYEVVKENRARYGAAPTHTLEEIRRLFELVPDRLRVFLCVRAGDLLGGTMVFELNQQAVCLFHLAHRDVFKQPTDLLLYRLVEYYGARGVRYLDLGPTGNYDFEERQLTLNTGNAFLKEEMGGLAFHRERWVWDSV